MSKAIAIPVAAVMFAVWGVYLGGLASLQASCAEDGTTNMVGVPGIQADLPCHKVYRLYWFYASWEIFVIVAIAVAAVTAKLAHASTGLVGLLAVATILFIQASNTFLSAEELPFFEEGQPLHRIRTITAGSIMTALMNAIAILAIGFTDLVLDRPVAEKPAGAV